MNKGAIQRFAIWARNELIAQVSQRAYQYGITKEGCGEANAVTVGGRALSTDEQRQRKELVDQIRSKGYTQVMEEVAYTWFNRFIALRFMEVNNYLPSHIRVFSDSTGAFKPEILNDVLHLDLPGLNKEKVAEYIESNQTDNLYRYLLLTQCNALNDPLPRMFEKMGGYTELLLPNNILKQDSVLGHMVADIPEEDWTDQVQIIGWLYQYYNAELKDDTFALLKKNVKITKERIPSATQLFTPDWIVRYMVENSLGRLWIEGHPNDELKAGWKYYLDEAEQEADVQAQLEVIRAEYRNMKPQDIKVIDPCMGSGHILVYAFDVLVQIYKTYGISERDAAQSILENNLYGLDIDDRAAQLAYFAVMMKARQYDRRIFSRSIQPHVYSIVDSNGLDASTIEYFTNSDPKLKKDFGTLVNELRDAKEYGSILNISRVDFDALYARIDEVRDDISIFREIVLNSILPLIQIAEVMVQKYDVVVTNPPYMGAGGMSKKIASFVAENYPSGKADLFAAFMKKCAVYAERYGLVGMMTSYTWMFLSGYQTLREEILFEHSLVSLIQPEYHSFFDEAYVPICTFVFRNAHTDQVGEYIRLEKFTGAANQPIKALEAIQNVECDYRYHFNTKLLHSIPGSPLVYWANPDLFVQYETCPLIQDICPPKPGLSTGENDRFLRFWHEVSLHRISFEGLSDKKWYPINKGGEYRRWYGNHQYIVNWENDGFEIKNFKDDRGKLKSRPQNLQYNFMEAVSWSLITTGAFSVRYYPSYFMQNAAGICCYPAKEKMSYVLAFLNTKPAQTYATMLSPTINTNAGDIARIPFVLRKEYMGVVTELTDSNISIAKTEWNCFEASWDFARHPIVPSSHEKKDQESSQFSASRMEKFGRIAWHYENWERDCEERFAQLKANEEELNRIFIDIYGLQDELTPEVEDEDVTVRKADLGRDIRSLISYAVGCMFGRYSLDVDGLAYAGGEWDASKYSTFIPDKDNIIPICDDDYFDDDITGRFVKWVETVYGKETLEENLKFIADALGGKGTPREVIRSYFINDFYADHLKIYQKRPIYWLFDSGKKNGFKALIYMHRYQSDLLARMRTDYVHEQQERYRTQLTHLADAIEHAGAAERVKLTKQQKKLQEQALEIQKYEEKIHHLADQNIQIDLDDGVKHNYELFADVLAKIK